ncbi:MCE family protein [Actinomadura sp. 21ATH]|uniref:MCE family protein n=1 Tax=Actinomadura sp. 21ATH TaxID=1735444 RepID=UPI0035C17932
MNDDARRTFSAALKLAVFVAVTSTATVLLAFTMSGARFTATYRYHAVFTDVTGLVKGDEVRVAGVRVGQVAGLRVHRGERALVTLEVDRTRPLPAGVRAAVRYRNLLGQRYVSLAEARPAAPGGPGQGRLPAGGTIPVTRTEPALDLTALFNGFRPLLRALEPADVNRLAGEIVQVLQGEGGTVTSLLARIGSLTGTLADRDAVIGRVVGNVTTVLATLDRHGDRLSELIVRLRDLASGLAGDRHAIGESLAAMGELTGAAAGLLEEARPALRDDIAGLARVSRTLAADRELLDATLRRLPGRLNLLARSTGYGSWINGYLCGLDVRAAGPAGLALKSPEVGNGAARCAP